MASVDESASTKTRLERPPSTCILLGAFIYCRFLDWNIHCYLQRGILFAPVCSCD